MTVSELLDALVRHGRITDSVQQGCALRARARLTFPAGLAGCGFPLRLSLPPASGAHRLRSWSVPPGAARALSRQRRALPAPGAATRIRQRSTGAMASSTPWGSPILACEEELALLREASRRLRPLGVALIASVSADTAEDFAEAAALLAGGRS